MTYSVDTNVLVEGWVRSYPIEVFPRLWFELERLIAAGRFIASTEVRVELERRDDALLAWAKQQEGLFVEAEEQVQLVVAEIMSSHSGLVDVKRRKSQADPWVIALAKSRGATVLSQEDYSPSPKKPHIPDVCDAYGVPHMKLVDLIRREGWRF